MVNGTWEISKAIENEDWYVGLEVMVLGVMVEEGGASMEEDEIAIIFGFYLWALIPYSSIRIWVTFSCFEIYDACYVLYKMYTT